MKKFRLLLGFIAMLCVMAVNAQTKKFEATVVDELGEPCIGASVIVKGTTSGVMTNVDGSFSIDVPSGAEVEISYIGYVTKTITDFSITQITLEEDRQQIEEVVVVGYGVQKKSHLTGSVATVPMDDVQDISSGNLAASLSGLVNGLSVSGGESRPGESAKMYVRNSNDISGVGGISQSPLYVIDGYIYPNDMTVGGNAGQNLGETVFNNLDPASIESISVLKDASAAVYGSRAANGVILVTTKKGKQGAPQISYSGNVGIAATFKHPQMLNSYQYGKLYNAIAAAKPESYEAASFNRRTQLFQADELAAMKGLNYNLIDKYWESAITHKHSLNLTGATEKVNYFAGVSYFNQDGNLGRLDYSRWTYRAGVDAKIGKGLKLGVNVSGDYGTKNTPYISLGSSASEDYNRLLTRPQYIPEYVEGMPIAAYGLSGNQANIIQRYHFNELQNNGDYSTDNTLNLNIGANIEYDFSHIKPLKGLKASLTYAKSIQTSKQNHVGSTYELATFNYRAGSGNHLYTPTPGYEDMYETMISPEYVNKIRQGNGHGDYGEYYRYMDRTDNYQLNFNVNYNRDFGKHSVGALFSIERSESESEYMWIQMTNPVSYGTGQSNAASDDSQIDHKFSRFEMGSLSYIGRINYSYDDKYLFEVLLRSDASTKFSPDNYWGLFPSVSAGWVISKEQFMQDVNWLDFLKLRASFGMTGRDNVTAWQWAQFYTMQNYRGAIFGEADDISSGSVLTMNAGQAAINADAHWDKAYKMNIGIDWNVLNNRLGFNIEYYNQWDREILTQFSGNIPSIVGNRSAYINYGKMNSWGVELTATWRDRVGEDFKYNIQLSTGYHDNKVLAMDFATGESAYQKIQPGGRTDTGMWGLECIGMFRNYQDIAKYFAENHITNYMGKTQDQVYPGMLIYKDVRGAYNQESGTYDPTPNGVVNATEDAVQLSSRSNPYGATVNFGIDWKGLSLSGQISAAWGGYSMVPGAARGIANLTELEYTNMPSFWNPDNMYVYQDIYDAGGNLVVGKNQDAYYPNLAFNDVNAVNSSFWRITGARASLNRVTIAYTLPKKWTNAIGIGTCRLNVTGQNLCWFFNPYPEKFMDPMTGSYGTYPTLRKFTLGLNINF